MQVYLPALSCWAFRICRVRPPAKDTTFNGTHTTLLLPRYLKTSCSIFPTLWSKICPLKSRKPDCWLCYLPCVTNECMIHGSAMDHNSCCLWILGKFLKKFHQEICVGNFLKIFSQDSLFPWTLAVNKVRYLHIYSTPVFPLKLVPIFHLHRH